MLRNELPALLLLLRICEGILCMIVLTFLLGVCEPWRCIFSLECLLKSSGARYVAFFTSNDWFDCHMFNVVNLLPLGLLFSSVSSTPSAQGTVANWHHTGIQDLWDTLSQTEREGAIPQHPSSKSISFFVASVLQQPIISPSAGGTLVTLLQMQFRHEIVLNMVAFILAPAPQHRWLGLEWFFFASFTVCFCTSYWY